MTPKPCPCGGAPEIRHSFFASWVRCPKCGTVGPMATGGIHDAGPEAVRLWNERPA